MESAEALEKWAAKTKKARAYVESIQDATVIVKELAETSFVVAEADKKRVEESLARLRTMYTKLETTLKQVKEAFHTNLITPRSGSRHPVDRITVNLSSFITTSYLSQMPIARKWVTQAHQLI